MPGRGASGSCSTVEVCRWESGRRRPRPAASSEPVAFRGVAPDLFRENSGVVAEGSFNADGSFTATNLLAKHDERYMPPELAGKMHESKSLQP